MLWAADVWTVRPEKAKAGRLDKLNGFFAVRPGEEDE